MFRNAKMRYKIGIILLLTAYISLGLYLVTSSSSYKAFQQRGKTDKIKLVMVVPAAQFSDKIYADTIREFEESNPDIEVEFQTVAGNYYQKLLVMIAGNISPDLMWMGQSFSEFADRGVFLDITDRIKKDPSINLDDYQQTVLSWYIRDAKIYALPFGTDIGFIVYNKDLFRKAGLPFPSDEWTFEEFLEAAKKLASAPGDGTPKSYGYQGKIDLGVFGAQIISHDGKQTILCSSPEMIKYFKTNMSMYKDWKVTPRPQENMMQGLDNYSYFAQGRTAMMQFYTWDLPFMQAKFGDMDWDIVSNPKVKQKAQWASSQAIVMSKYTRHPDEAWKLLKAFQSREFMVAMSYRGIPPNLRYAEDAVKQHTGKPEGYKKLLAMTSYLSPVPRVPHLQELMALYYNASEQIWAERTSPEEAMKKLEKEMRKRISESTVVKTGGDK